MLAWTYEELAAVRAVLEDAGVRTRWTLPAQELARATCIREFARLLALLGERPKADDGVRALRKRLPAVCGSDSAWTAMVDRMLAGVEAELDAEVSAASEVLEDLHRGLSDHLHAHVVGDGVLVGTVNAAKGQEFGHVLVLGDGLNGKAGRRRSRRRGETLALLRSDVAGQQVADCSASIMMRRVLTLIVAGHADPGQSARGPRGVPGRDRRFARPPALGGGREGKRGHARPPLRDAG